MSVSRKKPEKDTAAEVVIKKNSRARVSIEEISDALLNKPKLSEFLFEYGGAFFALSRARSEGFSANPISLPDIAAYLAIMGICDEVLKRE